MGSEAIAPSILAGNATPSGRSVSSRASPDLIRGSTRAFAPDVYVTTREGAAQAPGSGPRMTSGGAVRFDYSQRPGACALPIDNLEDYVALASAGRVHFDGIADFLADQRARGRRSYRHFAGPDVGFGLADDLERLLDLRVLVDQRHRGAELDRRAR